MLVWSGWKDLGASCKALPSLQDAIYLHSVVNILSLYLQAEQDEKGGCGGEKEEC
jgi:hypothetical protein